MYLFVAHVITCLLLLSGGNAAVDTSGPCPEGYEEGYGGRCYSFVTNTDTWSGARSNCSDTTDSDLVIINNNDELNYIKGRVTTGIWWIGFTDLSVEGTWKWLDCNDTGLYNQSLWGPNQPNDGIEDCGTFQAATQKLADYQCSRKYKFICEISAKGFSVEDTNVRNVAAAKVNDTTAHVTWDVSQYNCDVIGYRVYFQRYGDPSANGSIKIDGGNASELTLSLAPDMWWEVYVAAIKIDRELDSVGPASVWLGECPGWHVPGFNGSCYWFQSEERNWWYSHRNWCKSYGSDLVIIDTQDELEYILNQTELIAPNGTWWIGYYDASVEGLWQWVDCGDTDEWQRNLWAPREPAELDDCATLKGNTGHLEGQICDQKFPFICEVSPKDFSKEDTKPSNLTAIAVTSISIEVTWDVSLFACDVIGYRVYYNPTSDQGNIDWVFIYGGAVSSVVLSGLAKETEYSIGVAALTTVEELEQVGPVSVTTPWGCPAGFEEGPGDRSCYHFYNATETWASARGGCRGIEDGDIVIVDDVDELKYLVRRMEEVNPGQMWWIGYYDVSVEGVWRWVDCQPTADWQMPLRPDDEPMVGTGDCGYLIGVQGDDEAEIRASVCDDRKYFICEVIENRVFPGDANAHNVAAFALTPDSFRVTWDISPDNCDVIGYNVYYQKESSSVMEEFLTVNGGNVSNVEVVVSTSTESTVYLVSVAALNTVTVLDRVGPVSVTLNPGDPVTSPAYSSTDAVLFIVFNQTVGWFSSMMQVQLATGVANVLNRYTQYQQRDTAEAFGPSDVIFLSIYNTGSDLHIVTWVRDASSSKPGVPLDPTRVLSAISAEQTYFQNFMGPTFQYTVGLVPSPTATTTAPPTGLDDWLIAVIAVGVLLLLILLGLVIFKCGSNQKQAATRIDLHNEYAGGSVYERFTPTSFSSDGTWNPAFKPMQENQRDNSITTL